ncbi:deferrochelatase/peroxidase EfeB [Aquihabitans sp. G128]|uniref:iron uptake transporter deferrochelatase/peroxidase subunit n=1 Tax=Aquihabitans sp. G128 TaxID=2849779 RepID=UPI001C23DA5F|nr:iron uptake transporter deferrochelatase/peroxidase subunit [Aquihabitans sp. G128]QXC63393.1 deferrochelatase/peroxidase EfeB [Aquihabitans sp. G128]
MSEQPRISRRKFVVGGGAGVAGLAGAAALGWNAGKDEAPASADGLPAPVRLPFHGTHQTGITSHAPAAALMASFNLVADNRDEVRAVFKALTEEFDTLMSGTPVPDRGEHYPPLDTGSLGTNPPPADLTLTLAIGASMFDDRFGLAARKPRELFTMTKLANDRLDQTRCHGDLLVNISGDSPDVCLFALRQVMRRTRANLVLKWMVEGFNRREAPKPGKAQVRNLLGFKDGTANLDPSSDALMGEHVWVAQGDGEPAWAVGGSYQAVRIIRMLVEQWDRAQLGEQERIIGRVKASGAPLGEQDETDDPDYEDDPRGDRIPLDAHIRLANPRTKATEKNKILRRGFSYSRGFDPAGRLDQGLAFVSFQRSLDDGFLAVQDRLSGEPLEEYIRAEGGGYFFAFPGVQRKGAYLGQALLA